jgi:predicted LPLAT superfamily acyltransferase
MSDPTANAAPQWRSAPRGGRLGNGFFVVLVRCGGMWLTPFFLCWVALYFLVAAPAGRRASFDLARRLGRGATRRARLWFAFRHFFTFGTLLLDRVAILGGGQAAKYRIEFHGEEHIRQALAQGSGAILLTAHLGNWEAMGHLLTRLQVPVVMVMFDGVDARLRATVEDMARNRSFRIIYTDGSPTTAAAILGALRRGELVGMMGDRAFAGDTVEVEILGGRAQLPIGSYAIGAAAHTQLVHVFAVRRGWRRYRFCGFPAVGLRYRDRRNKRQDLRRWAQDFAARLEEFILAHPYQWGNFYPFFTDPAPGEAALPPPVLTAESTAK